MESHLIHKVARDEEPSVFNLEVVEEWTDEECDPVQVFASKRSFQEEDRSDKKFKSFSKLVKEFRKESQYSVP